MWTIKLSNGYGWYLHYYGVGFKPQYRVLSSSRELDPWEQFWIALVEHEYKSMDPANTTTATGINYNRKIIKEIIKRKIPFKLQYNISEDHYQERDGMYYSTYIDYTVVVDDPKYAVLCKLTWGEQNRTWGTWNH